jgi:regulatory protein
MADEALHLALQALGRKERSVAELGSWLRGRGVDAPDVDAVIGRLVEDGALDDARFARRYAEDKRELARWGNERIRAALLERGVPPGDVEDAVASDATQELERAVGLLRARPSIRDDRDRQKALEVLVRRGYESEVAYEAIRRVSRGCGRSGSDLP